MIKKSSASTARPPQTWNSFSRSAGGELWGIADRTDYDLSRHQEVSGQDLTYFDDETKEKYIPYVIEPSLGADRMVLAFLCSAYDEEVLDAEKNDVRTVLHFHPALAPVKIGVLPLSQETGRWRTEDLPAAFQEI